MQCVNALEELGYELSLSGDSIKVRYAGKGSPDNTLLLAEVKDKKVDVIAYLKDRVAAKDKKEMQDIIKAAYRGELHKPAASPVE